MWGSFVFVWCVVFNQGCCVFIQYTLLKACCEWMLIQPWTQVMDYSLPGLTWHTRLRIDISQLSISGIVVHDRCYISHCFCFSVIFYDSLLVDLSFCCFVFLSSQESILTILRIHVYFSSDWSLNFIIFVMVLLHHIMVYYITKLHYSRLLYLILSWLLFSIVFIILFLFLFYFSISFTFTLQILFDLVLHLLFYLVLVLLYLLSFYIIIYPA